MSNRKKKEVLRKQQEKQKRISITAITVAVILILGIAIGICFMDWEEKVPTAPPVAGTITERAVADISRVEISTGEIDYAYRASEFFGFIVEGYESELLDHFTAAGSVVYAVEKLSYTEKIEDVKSLADYGLENTKKSVTVKYNDETSFKLLMGDKCGDFEYYVMEENGTVVYKMLATDYELLMIHPKEFRLKDVCEVEPTSVTSVIVEKNGEKEVEVVKDVDYKPTNEYQTVSYLVKYPYENVTAALGTLQNILDEVTDYNAVEVVEENVEDFAKYGLTEDKATVLKITDAYETVELRLGDKKDDNVYAACGNKNVVYLVSAYLSDLLKEYSAVNYVEDFIGIHNIKDVSSIELTKGSEKHTLKMSKDSNGKSVFSIDGDSVEDKEFRQIYQYVIGITMEDIVDKKPEGKVYMTVKYNFNDSTSVTYTYYDYDKEYCIVKASNGLSCLSLKEELNTAFDKVEEGA